MVKLLLIVLVSLATIKTVKSQLSISNGVSLPPRDTTYVLVVFAEVDFSTGGCPDKLTQSFGSEWPKDKFGNTLPPRDADLFFDCTLHKNELPKGFITDYYHQASFGEYVLLGDYFPYTISIPCNQIKTGSAAVKEVLRKMDTWLNVNHRSLTAHGFPLSRFDNWSMSATGEPKLKKPDGKTDLVYIIWRNNRFLTSTNTLNYSGYGVTAGDSGPFLNSLGTNNYASFNVSEVNRSAYVITIAEHLHGIFGGNNWHSSGGRGIHTFPAVVATYGLTGQFNAAMQGPSGWDRWMMNWKHPDKVFVTSCMNEVGKEASTEDFSLENNPNGGVFILRDFMKTGDAVRIKLPHINWKAKGDVKNQYLWLENRRMVSRFDEWYHEDCADNHYGNFKTGTPGLYAYIQVGKDQKSGGSEINASTPALPNALASPFFPFTAEGNWDFYFDFENIQEGTGHGCNWNNKNVPINKKKSKPNPFTGNNDLFFTIDADGDGKLQSGDGLKTGMSEVVGDTVIHNYHGSGDWEDAFGFNTGVTEISLSTNPAPVPVYTLATDLEHKRFTLQKGKLHEWENRTIWLNGLSINVLDDNINGTGEVKISIRWDNYEVSSNVRWCGNIVLSPHDFDSSKPALVLKKGKTLLLDRATSATWIQSIETDEKGKKWYSERTHFTVLENAGIMLEDKSTVVLDNKSKWVLKSGSRLETGQKVKIIVKPGSELIVEEGASLRLGEKSKIIKK